MVVQYWFGAANDTVALAFLDATGKVIREYLRKADSSAAPAPLPEDGFAGPAPAPSVPNRHGVNTFMWNMRYPDASSFQGMILWAAGVTGRSFRVIDVDKVLTVELNKDLAKLRAAINANLPRINTTLKAAGLKEIESTGPMRRTESNLHLALKGAGSPT